MTLFEQDEMWMHRALVLAQRAALKGEVPVAAIVVGPEGLIASAINTRERQQTPLGHAEIFAIHKASKVRKSWRLTDCTLYVTLEPCLMCTGAIQQSRIPRVVYGAKDQKEGAHLQLKSITDVTPGVLEEDCSQLIKSFFKSLRSEKTAIKSTANFRKRASTIVIHDNKILGFHAKDPLSSKPYFFLPGGALEGHETPLQAAERECFEETGYKVKILQTTEFIRKYDFFWNGEIYHCETFFYLGVLKEKWEPPKKIQDATYNLGADWVPLKDITRIFHYSKDILWAVQKLVKTSKKLRSQKT